MRFPPVISQITAFCLAERRELRLVKALLEIVAANAT